LKDINLTVTYQSMAINLELTPKRKRATDAPCCVPVVYPDIARVDAERMALVAKALADPVRLQLVDVLRRHAGKVCVSELTPLFDVRQSTVSHHLKVLRDAGIVASERPGLWAYYYVIPGALDEFSAWLRDPTRPAIRPPAPRAASAAPPTPAAGGSAPG
jgi:ArsR family transcriptional regulator